jgi:hypothetical protein
MSESQAALSRGKFWLRGEGGSRKAKKITQGVDKLEESKS